MRKASTIESACRLDLQGKKVSFAFQLTRKNMEEKSVAKILGSTPLEMDCWRTSRRKPGNKRLSQAGPKDYASADQTCEQ